MGWGWAGQESDPPVPTYAQARSKLSSLANGDHAGLMTCSLLVREIKINVKGNNDKRTKA